MMMDTIMFLGQDQCSVAMLFYDDDPSYNHDGNDATHDHDENKAE